MGKLTFTTSGGGDHFVESEMYISMFVCFYRSLVSHLNEKINKMEEDLAQPNVHVDCAHSPDCHMPPAWKTPIENILKRAEQVWPSDHSNDGANKVKEEFFASFIKQGVQPMPISRLRDFLFYFENLTIKELNPFKETILEIWDIIIFPGDIRISLEKLSAMTVNTGKFDEITAEGLAIAKLKGFPNKDGRYRYCSLIRKLIPNEKSEIHSKTSEEEKEEEEEQMTNRRNLFMEFRPLHHLHSFVNNYNSVARIYRSPKYSAKMKNLSRLLNYVRTEGPDSTADTRSALVEEANAILSEGNYELFNGTPICSDYVGNIEAFLSDFTALKITPAPNKSMLSLSWNRLTRQVNNLDKCNIWNRLHALTEEQTSNSYSNIKSVDELAEQWRGINEDLTFYLSFLKA